MLRERMLVGKSLSLVTAAVGLQLQFQHVACRYHSSWFAAAIMFANTHSGSWFAAAIPTCLLISQRQLVCSCNSNMFADITAAVGLQL